MKDFQSIESKEIPEAQTAALQGRFRFPAVDSPFAKYVLTHCHLSYQNISRESCITTREFCCCSNHPHLDSYFTLCTAVPFLFIISCWKQTHDPMMRWVLLQQQQPQPPLCAVLLFCEARPPPGSGQGSALQLAEARRDQWLQRCVSGDGRTESPSPRSVSPPPVPAAGPCAVSCRRERIKARIEMS